MRMRNAMLSTALVLLYACAGSQGLSVNARSQTIEAGYDQTFQAVVDYISQRGFEFRQADKESGVIESEYRDGAGWGDAISPGDRRARVAARVTRDGENAAKVTVSLISEVRDQSTGWQEVTMGFAQENSTYKRFFDAIAAMAKGESIR